MSDQPPTYSAPALEKGLDILELLARLGRPLGISQIAEGLGRSKSEIYRMTQVLLARGYLQREPGSDGISLSSKLFGLGIQTGHARDLVSTAAPAIERLADEVAQAAHLIVAHRGETVVVASSSGEADMTFALKVGYRRPLIDAHSGLVLMAFQTARKRDQMIAESADRELSADERARLLADLHAIRAAGSIIRESRDVIGVTDISSPILGADGHALACITISAVTRRSRTLDTDSMLVLLKSACRKIEDQLLPHGRPPAHDLQP